LPAEAGELFYIEAYGTEHFFYTRGK